MGTSDDVGDRVGRGAQRFAALVGEVPPAAWGAPTPCTEWDVRALVNHVAMELRWIPPLLAGATIAEVGDRFDGDLLGDAPASAVAGAAAEAAQAAASADPAATVHVSSGDVRAAAYLEEMAAELLVHGWDLARAAGADERLPGDLVAATSAWFAEREDAYRAMGAIDSRPDVPEGADAQTRLLAAFGRRT